MHPPHPPEVTSFCWASLRRFPVPMEAQSGKSTRLEMKHINTTMKARHGGTCLSSTWEMEAGGSGVQDRDQPQCFKMRSCPKERGHP